jgi:hypothetical protein
MGVNMIKIHCMLLWKYHNKTHHFVQLIYVNKNWGKKENSLSLSVRSCNFELDVSERKITWRWEKMQILSQVWCLLLSWLLPQAHTSICVNSWYSGSILSIKTLCIHQGSLSMANRSLKRKKRSKLGYSVRQTLNLCLTSKVREQCRSKRKIGFYFFFSFFRSFYFWVRFFLCNPGCLLSFQSYYVIGTRPTGKNRFWRSKNTQVCIWTN